MADLSVFLIPLGVALVLSLLAFWVWMLIDCLTKESTASNNRLVWALVIIFTKFIGAALYYFLRYRNRDRLPLATNGAGI